MADGLWSPGAPTSRPFPTLGVVLTVLLITLTGLGVVVWVTITLALGSSSILLGALVLAAAPALLIAWSSRMMFVALLPRPPSYARTALTAYVVIVVVAAASVWLADRAYETGVARAAEACSADEIAVLRSIVLSSALAVDPVGGRDGACRLEQPVAGDRDAVQATLTAAMGDAGFVETDNELGTRTFTRDAVTVVTVVSLPDDTGQVDVTLTIPPG